MLIGTLLSAVFGGLAGLCYAMVQDHGPLQSLLSYQFGGMIAIFAFIAVTQAGSSKPARTR